MELKFDVFIIIINFGHFLFWAIKCLLLITYCSINTHFATILF